MLTDLQIRKFAAKETPYKVSDARGLYMRVAINGSKTWSIAYRLDRVQKTLALGVYPEVSLSQARDKVSEVKRKLREGHAPSVVGDTITFGQITDEYIRRKEMQGLAERTIEKNRWLAKIAKDGLGQRPIRNIKPAEVWDVLQAIENSGRRETAIKTRGLIAEVFRYAIRTSRADGDPTTASKGALVRPKVTHLAAITDPKKFGDLLVAIDEYDGWPPIRAALQFSALVFARPVEIRGARWEEIEGDVWRVPAARMKGRRPQDVPLSKQAILILQKMRPYSDRGLVFPGIRSTQRTLSENTINIALRRMGFSQTEHCAHGFRSSASTMLNTMGFVKDIIEIQLSHLDEDEVRRAYNRALYWPERVAMMQRWADYLDELRRHAIV